MSAVSTSPYSLANSNGVDWQEIDSTKLRVTASPSASQSTLLTANADLWTENAGFNQDIGIFVSDNNGIDALLAWKESGGFAGTFSPNAALVQTLFPMTSGHTYVFKLKWKTNTPAAGATIHAGAGPIAGQFSPTSLVTETFSSGGVPNFVVSTQSYSLTSSNGSTWQPIDPTNLATTLSPVSNSTAVLGANADLWTVNAGYNQDIGIFVSDNGGTATLVAWKESGGSGGTYSPNAAFVKATYPMIGGHSYVFKLNWKTNRDATGATIAAGAGPIAGHWSPTSLLAETIASGANPYTAVSTLSYSLTSSDGATWQPMDAALNVSVNGSDNTTVLLGANADLFTGNAGYNQDIGIFVSDNGTTDALVAWKESGGYGGIFSPNAAFAQASYPMYSGHTYVFKLKWKTNTPAAGATIYAGAGPIPGIGASPTRLIAEIPPLITSATTPPAPGLGEQSFYKIERHRLNDRMSLDVNTVNGNLILHESDLSIRGTGLSLGVDRYFNSLATNMGAFGERWTMGTGRDVRLTINGDGSVTFAGPSGYQVTFTKNAGVFVPTAGLDASLTLNGDGSYTIRSNASAEKYNFNSSGTLTSDVDRNGNSLSFAYNLDGTLASITDTQGRVTTFNYIAPGVVIRMTDPSGRRYNYGYDADKNLTTYTDPAGKLTKFSYSADGNMQQITDPRGNIIKIVPDTSHRIQSFTQVTDVNAGTGPTTTYTYTPASSKTVIADPNSHQTTYNYDTTGKVTSVMDALGHSVSTTYTADNHARVVTDPNLGVTTAAYDPLNNLSQIQQPNPVGTTPGAITQFQYTDAGNPYSPTAYMEPQGTSSNYSYDASGNLVGATDQLAAQNQVKLAYNPNGTVSSATDARLNVTSFGYDPKGNLTSETYPAPLGGRAFTPDSLSRTRTATDGKGQTTTYTYDTLDRVTNVAYADSSSVSQDFDENGNLTSRTDSLGTTTFIYDTLNRQTKKVQPSPSATVTYEYDPASNLSELNDGSGNVNYLYDADNRLNDLQDQSLQHTTFGYDSAGNRTTTNYPNNISVAMGFDGSNRVTSILAQNSVSHAVLTNLSYVYLTSTGKDMNLRSSATDNVSGITTTYTYDVLDRLNEAKASNGSFDYQYSYDAVSNRCRNDLLGCQGPSDPYQYNAANELTSANGTTYTYDANGNLTASSTGMSATYNAKDQMVSLIPAGGTAITFAYGGIGQSERTSAGTTTFVNDQLGVDTSKTSTGSTHYIHDSKGGLIAKREPSGSMYYYLFDALSSVIGLTDSSGALVNTYKYDAFGQLTASTGTVPNPFKFASYYSDTTGLFHVGQRYYDPSQGRWSQQDPVNNPTNPHGWNRYVYAGDDPVNFTDPSGRYCIVSDIAGYLSLVAAVGSAFIAASWFGQAQYPQAEYWAGQASVFALGSGLLSRQADTTTC